MSARKLLIAAALAFAGLAGGASPALAQDAAAELRASGHAGEQWDGYMGVVGSPPAAIRARVDSVNIQRRAHYTDLARSRGVTIQEAAAAVACQIFAMRIAPGQYYRLQDGVWRQRNGNEPVPRPSYCS